MLITFGQLNTLYYGGGGTVGTVGTGGCRTSLVSWLYACWVLTGLSGCGAALQGYRRSFFSVKGLVVALRGDH